MKDKVLFYAFGVLVVVILALNIKMYFLKREHNAVLDQQIKELEVLKEQYLTKRDSIAFLKQQKEVLIAEKEKSLYDQVAKAKENNTRYEQIKYNIATTDDADSLARQLTKRYSER